MHFSRSLLLPLCCSALVITLGCDVERDDDSVADGADSEQATDGLNAEDETAGDTDDASTEHEADTETEDTESDGTAGDEDADETEGDDADNDPEDWPEDGGAESDTPLVLNFDAKSAVSFEAAPAAAFDISGRGRCLMPQWPSAATPYLAWDRDGSGAIDAGSELFGNGFLLGDTRANHGFEALAALDDNGDGVVDAADAHFSELVLWRDLDQNRRGTGAELESLADAGVTRLSLDFELDVRCDARHNCERERSVFATSSGASGRIVDVYPACD